MTDDRLTDNETLAWANAVLRVQLAQAQLEAARARLDATTETIARAHRFEQGDKFAPDGTIVRAPKAEPVAPVAVKPDSNPGVQLQGDLSGDQPPPKRAKGRRR